MGRTERYAAFLRAINVGGRRVSGEDLASAVAAADGVTEATSFLASGNVVFSEKTGADAGAVAAAVEEAIAAQLGFDSKVFLRSQPEIARLADFEPFTDAQLERSEGKPQISFYDSPPPRADRETVLGHATESDPLVVDGRELHWLPSAGTLESDLDLITIERILGPSTMRTRNTIVRLNSKFFA